MKKENHTFVKGVREKRDARWAEDGEIMKSRSITRIDIEAGDCPAGGIPIISDGRTAYVDGSDTHTLVFGATGSKKSRLFGMPLVSILTMAGESFIATDPKGELYQKTSGLAAAKGYQTFALNFRDFKKSDYWNPLALIYDFYHTGNRDEAVAMMNDLVRTLTEPQRLGAKNPYWVELGCAHALANLLFFIETASPAEANLFNYANFSAARSDPKGTEELSKYTADGSIASVNYKGVLTNKDAEKTFAGVASTITAMVRPFIIRKTLCQILSKSSFDIKDIGRQKTAIYVIIPDEKTTLHFLVAIFIKQIYEALIYEAQREQDNRLPVRLNFVLDEFCNIPPIPDINSMISAARSRNMRFFLIAQSLGQLRQRYGNDADTIKGNCDNWVFLTSREYTLLKEIYNLCGGTFYTSSGGVITRYPLVTISDMQRFSKENGETLILHGRHFPFISELPDIDDYLFKAYPPARQRIRPLPDIEYYDASRVISEIKAKKRPLPFSREVYGEDTLYGETEKSRSILDVFKDMF
jgi:type IV secretion system protein VirD4